MPPKGRTPLPPEKRPPFVIRVQAQSFDVAVHEATKRALDLCNEEQPDGSLCASGWLRFKYTELYVRPWKNYQDDTEYVFELEWS